MLHPTGRAARVAILSTCLLAACASPRADDAAVKHPTPAAASRAPAPASAITTPPPPFPRASPAEVGIDPEKLADLARRAEASRSDALVVIRDGKLVLDERFGHEDGPIETMSMTKSLVALVIGRLVEIGKLRSIDEPVSHFYPEWKQGKKAQITVRHLLEQTSGIQANRTTEEIYASPDFVKLALAAELGSDPGSAFFYNNKAVNLLAGIVRIASGKAMDDFARAELFAPMGIRDVEWERDRAGNPHGMSGAGLRPLDLARVGQMMLDHGELGGRRILGAEWIAKATAASPKNPRYGWLTWVDQESSFVLDDSVFDAWKKGGLEPAFISRLRPLKDRVFKPGEDFLGTVAATMGGEKQAALESWHDHTWRRGLPDAKALEGRTVGFHFDGYLGQYVVVVPEQRLVAVRMRRFREAEGDAPQYGFHDFPKRIRGLVAPSK